MARILVPTDGSKASEEALALAIDLAKGAEGKVYALHVAVLQRTLPLGAKSSHSSQRGEEILKRALHLAQERGYEVETILLQAREAGITVVDEAIERAVDLIIIGMAHKKRLGEFCLGRIAPFIFRNAPCRVWICREPSS